MEEAEAVAGAGADGNMPAKSIRQQKLMGMAYAYKQGKLKKASAKVKKLAASMSLSQLKEYAETSREGLPYRKAKPKGRRKYKILYRD